MAGEMASYISSAERATAFMLDAADVTAEQLRAAADVFRTVAGVDRRPLDRAVTVDGSGNPIRTTPEQIAAVSVASAAREVRDRAEGWARYLDAAAARRESAEAKEEDGADRIMRRGFALHVPRPEKGHHGPHVVLVLVQEQVRREDGSLYDATIDYLVTVTREQAAGLAEAFHRSGGSGRVMFVGRHHRVEHRDDEGTRFEHRVDAEEIAVIT